MTVIIQKHGSKGMTTRTPKVQSEGEVSEVRRGRPQARSDEETRALILDAARGEFASNGYAATSMDSVARRARVSTKTLYRLIPNKAALFEAMITDRIDRFASVVRLRACDGTDIEAALCEALLVCGELILDADVIALQRMILGESDKFPDVAETFYHKAIKRTESTLASWLRAQHKRGLVAVDDADAAAGMLLGMLAFQPQRAVMFGHAPPPGREDIMRRAQACAILFLRGYAH
ncbi:TetR/AcrR family transcriptional regulator [Bradyrhizobium sp. STM 3562]|uniref:TetR/AcrR family transcriptional regulator n=1 Tax=Bradyrhizobium sp. STM 3562 TaxID=578924 RepID=UPI00388F356B